MDLTQLPTEGSSRPARCPDGRKPSSVLTKLTPDQFPLFMEFPVEVRLLIWKRVCFIPRVIDVYSSGTGCEALHNLDDKFHDLFGSDLRVDFNATHCSPPALLHVCQESRMVGLQSYTLAFGKGPFSATPPTSSNISFSCQINMPPHIYINWECDVVCPMGAESRDMKDMEVQLLETGASSGNMLRRLAIDPLQLHIKVGANPMDTPDPLDEEPELSWAQLLRECPNLKEIILYHLADDYNVQARPLELIESSEGVVFKKLENTRNAILDLVGGMEISRNHNDVRGISKAQEPYNPFIVSIKGLEPGHK